MIRLDPDLYLIDPQTLTDWRNDHRIFGWCRQNHLISPDQQSDWLKKVSADSSIKMLGIVLKELIDSIHLETPIGMCGITSISLVHRTAEFSIYISPQYAGFGYGKEALLLLLAYGFHNMDLHLIWGEVFEENPALKMFKEIGFIEEAKLRSRYHKKGRRLDTYIVSMTRDEFDRNYKPNYHDNGTITVDKLNTNSQAVSAADAIKVIYGSEGPYSLSDTGSINYDNPQ